MLSRPLPALAAALTCALLTGCQPPAPTPTPAPTYQCTPEAGGDPYNCSQAQYDDMVATDKLYAEAEAVYRKFFAEDERILRAGGTKNASKVLEETTAGAFLEDSLDYYRSLARDKSKLVGGEVKLVSLERQLGVAKGGSVVALRACIDATTTRIVIAGDDTGPGRLGSDVLYFGRTDGLLKIQGADGQEGGSC